MKILLSIPVLLFVFVNLSAQDKKTAMKFFEAGNFEEAIDESQFVGSGYTFYEDDRKSFNLHNSLDRY